MELIRWEPFAGFGNLPAVFNDLFDDDFERPWGRSSQSKWYPAMDVLESKDSYLIRAELPGMKKEDIKVEVKDGALVLSGESKSETPAEGVEYRHVERVAAKFWRSFSLPETVKQDGIEANYKDGILEVRVPKAEKAQPRRIEINLHQ
jgi:HSP20 family protein